MIQRSSSNSLLVLSRSESASGVLQVEPRLVHGPRAPMDVVVVLPVLLNGDIGEVDKHAVQLTGARGVFHCAEAAKSKLIRVAAQRAVRRHQNVQAQTKLPAAD